tara:strand:- start:615 stop:764 length:150 start_codon:yes stop_codon:yes gene_type:complete
MVHSKANSKLSVIYYLSSELGIYQLINADFCNGAILITFGALLGKVNLT